MVIGHYKISVTGVEKLPECPYHTGICSRTSLKDNREFYLFTSSDSTDKVTCYCKAQTGNNIVHRSSHLLHMYHIAFSKHTAPTGDPGRINGFHCQFTEFFLNGNTKTP